MTEQTVPKLFKATCDKWGDTKAAIRHKKYGIWAPYTWKYFWEQSKYFGLGLVSLGYKAGDRITIIGNNEPEWYYSVFASFCCRGLPVPANEEAPQEEIIDIVNDSGCKLVIVEDQEQVDKMLSAKDRMPGILKVIYWDKKGMQHYDDPLLMTYEEVHELGIKYEKDHPGLFEELIAASLPQDPVLLTYSLDRSGPHGGIYHSSSDAIAASDEWDRCSPTGKDDNYFSAYTLADGGELLYTVPAWLKGGACINFPEDTASISQDMREIGPTKMYLVPAIVEAYVSFIRSKINNTSWEKRKVCDMFLPVGYKVARLRLSNQPVNIFWRAAYWLGSILLFRQIKDWCGFSNFRVMPVVGNSMAVDSLELMSALGVDIRIHNKQMESPSNQTHIQNGNGMGTNPLKTASAERQI